ncbi:hypothetical protein [Pigmentiphaga daeguensis]|uniref:Uncharacterized protein n=1 Tax=Pigmentiphaga daeguensis TaxID=414049 RepID=A0ABN1BEX2_9BURK
MHHQPTTMATHPMRLSTLTVPRHIYERACAARDAAQRLYDGQTLALHQRSIAYLAANEEIHRLRQLLVAHGISAQKGTE